MASRFRNHQQQFEGSPKTVFIFEEDREARRGPCACDLLPLGGTQKSLSYLTRLRAEFKNVFFFSAGNAFVPGPYLSEKSLKGESASVVAYYSSADLTAYGAVARDFSKGIQFFNDAIKGAKFPVLGSNIYKDSKRILDSFLDLPLPVTLDLTSNMRIVSLSSLEDFERENYESKEIQVRDPAVEFLELSRSTGPEISLWVVLGDLSIGEVGKIRKLTRRPVLFFGGARHATSLVVDSLGNSIWMSGQSEGKALNRLTVAWDKSFFNSHSGYFLNPFEWESQAKHFSKNQTQYWQGIDKDNSQKALNYLMEQLPREGVPEALFKPQEVVLY